MKTILVDGVLGLVRLEGGMYEDMHELLETYPNKKIILTSANFDSEDTYGFRNMPYEVFTLKHDPEKADPAYYTTMLEHFGLSPDEVIYFEHGAEAVKSAESVGIKTFFYDSEKRDLDELKEWLDGSV